MIMILGQSEIKAITAAIARARANPLPWVVACKSIVPNQATGYVSLADREQVPAPPRAESVDLLLGYRLNVSCEEQPAGLCLHLSLSCHNQLPPHPGVLVALLQMLGFRSDDMEENRMWIEEFLVNGKPGGKALNLIMVMHT